MTTDPPLPLSRGRPVLSLAAIARVIMTLSSHLTDASVSAQMPRRYADFWPGQPWNDTSGHEIDAHGAGLLFLSDGMLGGTTWWYGSKRHGHPNVAPPGKYPPYSAYCYPPPDAQTRDGFTEGVNAYTSAGDLYNWRHVGLVFPANATGAHCLERPKVIRCPGTQKYVMWAKGFRPLPMNDKLAVVAIADHPAGPFTLANASNPFQAPGGDELADATVYVDEKKRESWLYWRSKGAVGVDPEKQQSAFFVAKLSQDCTHVVGQPKPIASVRHEAPAVFQWDGKVFLWTSNTTGWGANAAQLLVSESGAMDGPFVDAGNPTHDPTSFGTQSTYILKNPDYRQGSGRAPFIYVADRWQTNTTDYGRYVWLPLTINPNASRPEDLVRVTNPVSWRYTLTVPRGGVK